MSKGTGKTSLIQLAVNNLEEPKGIAYVNIPNIIDENMNPAIIIDVVRDALGWTSDPVNLSIFDDVSEAVPLN